MRSGLVLLALFSLALVPQASAEPFDCTGTGMDTTNGIVDVECDRRSTSGGVLTTRRAQLTVDTDIVGFRAGFEHRMFADETHTESRCTVYYQKMAGPGPDAFSTAPICASHRMMS